MQNEAGPLLSPLTPVNYRTLVISGPCLDDFVDYEVFPEHVSDREQEGEQNQEELPPLPLLGPGTNTATHVAKPYHKKTRELSFHLHPYNVWRPTAETRRQT